MPTAHKWRKWSDDVLLTGDASKGAEITRRLYEAAVHDSTFAVKAGWE